MLHKLYDNDWKKQIQNFQLQNLNVVVRESPEAIGQLRNRISMLEVVSELDMENQTETLGIPKQILIYNQETLFDRSAWELLKFPMIAKPLVADSGFVLRLLLKLLVEVVTTHSLAAATVVNDGDSLPIKQLLSTVLAGAVGVTVFLCSSTFCLDCLGLFLDSAWLGWFEVCIVFCFQFVAALLGAIVLAVFSMGLGLCVGRFGFLLLVCS
ncbi:hypothetical protein LWI28_005139 [Acer negundo]|uniref:Uncharacterized protein n=1 Tax=Acer negundo TaxID=4023 RepID=A0AAD5NRJ6_ACENE|nr:hypothetical protein LWI28_005139 [Acer negundo]